MFSENTHMRLKKKREKKTVYVVYEKKMHVETEKAERRIKFVRVYKKGYFKIYLT